MADPRLHSSQINTSPQILRCESSGRSADPDARKAARPYNNCVQIDLSRPGKPTDNAHVESFNGTLRAECLDVHWFVTLTEAKQIIGDWRREYSESRPHGSLGRTDSK
jgi:transposase InsO family protein